MLRILFVEDEPEAIDALRQELELSHEVCCKVVGFSKAIEQLQAFTPSVVILDLLQQGGDVAAQSTYEFIWNQHFCPIVVYSAQPAAMDVELHPFVRTVQKGKDSESLAARHVAEFVPHITALEEVRRDLARCVDLVLRDVAPGVFSASTDPEPDLLVRTVRRQVAARMDEASGQAASLLKPWEQYLYPPLGAHLRTGDILKVAGGSRGDPTAFRVVLTPSCDLVQSDDREAKVSEVLVAVCGPLQVLAEALNKLDAKEKRLKSAVRPVLTRGFVSGVIPIPGFPDLIPSMVADLRRLELLDLGEIGDGEVGATYTRVASVDSPFRELITWAYLQVAGRPGLPERDYDGWAEDVVASMISERSIDDSC